jgi:hypothetical protein
MGDGTEKDRMWHGEVIIPLTITLEIRDTNSDAAIRRAERIVWHHLKNLDDVAVGSVSTREISRDVER